MLEIFSFQHVASAHVGVKSHGSDGRHDVDGKGRSIGRSYWYGQQAPRGVHPVSEYAGLTEVGAARKRWARR